MDLYPQLHSIFVAVIAVGVGTAYLIAGIIACDRMGHNSEKLDKLLSKNDWVFAVTVVAWPIATAARYLYWRVTGR